MPDPQVLLTAFFALTLLVVVVMLVARWADSEGSEKKQTVQQEGK